METWRKKSQQQLNCNNEASGEPKSLAVFTLPVFRKAGCNCPRAVRKDSGAPGQVKQLCVKGCYGLCLVLLCAASAPCGAATFIGLLKVCDRAAMWPGYSGLGQAPAC